MAKRFLSVFLVLALSICLSLSVFAEEVPAGSSDSELSISASIGNVEQPLEESGVEPEQVPETVPIEPEQEVQPESFGVESETSVLPENSQANGESELFSQEVEIVEESTAGSEERHTPVIYYIDGLSGNDANSGTAESEAWQSLEKVNATEFGPGDKILFRAGSIWAGQLWPKGSGAEGTPIVIDQYGDGNKPIINGNGTVTETLRLFNQQYWEINNLELTNMGTDRASRRAVWIENHDFGTMNHIYLKNMYIHDVNGRVSDRYYEDGGIIFMVTGGAVESKFNDILIENNSFYMVDYDGIFIRNNWKNRGSVTDGIGPWIGNTNVVVRNNNLDNIGGDGIVVCESIAPLVERNVAKDCHIRATSTWSAGIWVINSEDALLQFNEGYLTRGDLDGQPFDCDGLCRNTTYQYNYSHDNEGGFMLICNWANRLKDFNTDGVIRYNISQNDRSKIFHYSGINTGFQIYNNTIYVGEGNNAVFSREDGVRGSSITYTNNIFYNEGNNFEYKSSKTACTFNNNLYYGNHPSSEPKDPNKLLADPKLVAPGTGGIGLGNVGGYKLLEGSPCIDAGVTISNNGGRDYFGNALPLSGIDIGAHEYSNDSSPVSLPVGTVWNAAQDYSCVSGQNQWTALMISGANSNATTWSNEQKCWIGTADYAIISETLMHPMDGYDAARCFTAPVAGTYRLTGTAKKNNVGGGDGVVVSIRRGKQETLWSNELAYDDSVGVEHDLTVALDAGDKIYFIVGRNGNDWYDQTEWAPTVTLSSLNSRLEIEGETGSLRGAAVVQDFTAASGHKIAGFLGNGAGNDAVYTIELSEAGDYLLKFDVVTGEKRTLFYEVNGVETGSIEVPAGSWDAVQQTNPVTISLSSGENQIRLYNNSRYAPSVDRFILLRQ